MVTFKQTVFLLIFQLPNVCGKCWVHKIIFVDKHQVLDCVNISNTHVDWHTLKFNISNDPTIAVNQNNNLNVHNKRR